MKMKSKKTNNIKSTSISNPDICSPSKSNEKKTKSNLEKDIKKKIEACKKIIKNKKEDEKQKRIVKKKEYKVRCRRSKRLFIKRAREAEKIRIELQNTRSLLNENNKIYRI